jgi:nucleotidyltransferase substrate binding protein (TIGR01987 family)
MTTRFLQRVQNFNRSLKLLDGALAIPGPSETERLGIIKSYEMCFELAWKAIKDYLESQGLDPKFPRETIKYAIQTGILVDEDAWMRALTDRNIMVHTYDEKAAMAVEKTIRESYHPLLKKLAAFFEEARQ